jgi:hypothetical protein
VPIVHTIDAARRVVQSRLWDVVTETDAWGSAAALMNDPSFDPTFAQLADMREVKDVDVSTRTVRELALIHIFAPQARRALVVASDLQYGIGHMTASFAEGGDQQVAVFRTVAEAERWLGIVESQSA